MHNSTIQCDWHKLVKLFTSLIVDVSGLSIRPVEWFLSLRNNAIASCAMWSSRWLATVCAQYVLPIASSPMAIQRRPTWSISIRNLIGMTRPTSSKTSPVSVFAYSTTRVHYTEYCMPLRLQYLHHLLLYVALLQWKKHFYICNSRT